MHGRAERRPARLGTTSILRVSLRAGTQTPGDRARTAQKRPTLAVSLPSCAVETNISRSGA